MSICLALTALLSACIPIGIRGTSVVDAGARHPAATPPSSEAATMAPADPAKDTRQV
jgi:hypothetical protein